MVRCDRCDSDAGMLQIFNQLFPVSRLKKNIKYNYSGARTKDGIMDFANRIAG